MPDKLQNIIPCSKIAQEAIQQMLQYKVSQVNLFDGIISNAKIICMYKSLTIIW